MENVTRKEITRKISQKRAQKMRKRESGGKKDECRKINGDNQKVLKIK